MPEPVSATVSADMPVTAMDIDSDPDVIDCCVTVSVAVSSVADGTPAVVAGSGALSVLDAGQVGLVDVLGSVAADVDEVSELPGSLEDGAGDVLDCDDDGGVDGGGADDVPDVLDDAATEVDEPPGRGVVVVGLGCADVLELVPGDGVLPPPPASGGPGSTGGGTGWPGEVTGSVGVVTGACGMIRPGSPLA